jgi:hypothetical protein
VEAVADGGAKEDPQTTLRARFPAVTERGKEFFSQLVTGEFEITGDIGENLGKGADFKGRVRRDRNVMLNLFEARRKTHVAVRSARNFKGVASRAQSEFVATEITREFHAGMTSSLTR